MTYSISDALFVVYYNNILCFHQKQNVIKLDKKSLYAYFRKYGAIESIEIIKRKTQKANKKKKPEAYITFRSDKYAYAAVKDNKNRKKRNLKRKYKVQPADTWKQPRQRYWKNWKVESITPDEDEGYEPPIFMLNEDCFEEIFQYLCIESLMNLLEVSKSMNNLVRDRGFRHIKTYWYYSDLYGDSYGKALAEIRKELKCCKYISHLNFGWRILNKSLHRFLEVFGKHVGKNIQSASFGIEQRLKEHHFAAIKPIFANLTSLRLGACSHYELNFDELQTMCPNLTTLKIRYHTANLFGSNRPWPKLQNMEVYTDINTDSFRVFLQQNPQITVIE